MKNIYFIRHNWRTNRELKNKILEQNNRVAIHFNEEEHINWNDYSEEVKQKKNFKKAWEIFSKIADEGGIIISQYDPSYFLIGTVEPKSKIEFLPELIEQNYRGYKTLLLTEVKRVDREEYPLFSVIKPMYSTVSKIKKNHNYIMYAYGKEELDFSLENMHYKVQELMCEEWLRSSYCPPDLQLNYPLLKVGSYLEAIDIYGKTKSGKKLFAQVTFLNQGLKKKLKALRGFAGDKNIKIIFSNSTENTGADVISVPLSDVWEDFGKDTNYNQMLKEMIGLV